MTTTTNTKIDASTETVWYTAIDSGLPIKKLSKTEARKVTDEIKAHLNDLPLAIHKALQGQAYLVLGYKNVEEWSLAEFGLSRSRIYQINAWQAREIAIKERFQLSDGWSVAEEQYRHLNAENYTAVVNSIQSKLNTASSTKGAVVNADDVAKQVLKESFTKFKEQERAKKETKAKGDENKGSNHAEPNKHNDNPVIAAPVKSYELLVVKAETFNQFTDTVKSPVVGNATKLEMAREVVETASEWVRYLESLENTDTEQNVDSTVVHTEAPIVDVVDNSVSES